MHLHPHPRPDYTAAERASDAVVHVTGIALVLLAVPVLIVLAVLARGDAPAIFAVGIYGAGLAGMICFSALYNLTPGAAFRWLFQRLDHAAIYLKIAGTYTPFALLSGQGLALTVGMWCAAGCGVALKVVSPSRWRWFALMLYLGMGWAGVVAGQTLLAALPSPVIALMVAGGLVYTLGVGFYVWERLPFHYTIWHVMVLLGSLLFYSAVVWAVVDTGGLPQLH